MIKNVKEFLRKNTWFFPVLGAVTGLIIALGLFKRAYCFYVYQPGGIAIIASLTGVSAIIAGVIRFFTDRENNLIRIKGKEIYIYTICSLLFTGAFVILVSPLFRTYDKNSCVQDFDTLVALTEQEGSAVVNEDMDVIRNIYTPDAIVTRANTGESWAVYSFYSIKFATEDHCTNSHGHYDVISFTPDEVTMTTSSQGTWGLQGQGCTLSFSNPAGSDQWTFEKIGGEWKIVNFEFNKK
jgi:hypothetical protein